MPKGNGGLKRLSKDDIKYIRDHCYNLPDKEISEKIGCTVNTVTKWRTKLGVDKTKEGIVPRANLDNATKAIFASKNLNENQRAEFFKTQLANSLFYETLKQQFTENEVNFYLEEWGSLCVQFEDVLATERRQIDELIKAEIMGNRILRNVKIAEEELMKLQIEVEEFRKKNPNISSDEQAQERDNQLMTLIRSCSAQVDAMTNNYQKNVDLKQTLLEQLDASRKDRSDQIRKGGTTFAGLVQILLDRKNREKEGKYIELVRMATQNKKNEWRKQQLFADGKLDSILLDEESELPNKDYTEIREVSYLVSKYSSLAGKRILLVDENKDHYRFLLKYFNKNSVEILKEITDQKFLYTYDLIILSNEIKDVNVELFVDKLIEKDSFKESDFLLYANDQDFVKNILIKMAGKRKMEVCSYDEIKKWSEMCQEQLAQKK